MLFSVNGQSQSSVSDPTVDPAPDACNRHEGELQPGRGAHNVATDASGAIGVQSMRESFLQAWRQRMERSSTAAKLRPLSSPAGRLFSQAEGSNADHGPSLLLTNCRVLDLSASSCVFSEPTEVRIRGDKVISVGRGSGEREEAEPDGGQTGAEGHDSSELITLDCGGHYLMPGLCDAHVHCTAATADLRGLMSLPESYTTAKAALVLEGMLCRGFTTIRDCGGADFGLAQAVDEGLILGPKILFTGKALSQTGGHGDFRSRGEEVCACGPALRGLGRVCDGEAEVRKAARDELRKGAACIKVMASGGVASPTDKLTSTQFSLGELRAIVEEAEAVGSYVCAHAYTPRSIQRAMTCGVRSIEHGNYLDEETATLMVEKGTYLVPTLITYQMLALKGKEAGMAADLVDKVGDCVSRGLESLRIAHSAGVMMCFGSDLLGELHPHQSEEFGLRCQVLPCEEVIRAATINCARLFGLEFGLGKVAPGFAADLVLLSSDPLGDGCVLARPGETLVLVIKGGLIAAARKGLDLNQINQVLSNHTPPPLGQRGGFGGT